ncbi:MAG: four helix bundle protein [Planctomycetes bacterium]|nr:four helix bundle protein [Planctomycetota bacterium]MBU1518761.1 four helix bundle protein [Planctomycetota bacterium]MBU2457230.1 four helix bundle protein [Planctomycetota bacterium]MBU2596151.1 four helix bundle protein [Planctomycetota bacterium]
MGEPARSFQDLIVWQKAHSFVVEIYKMTAHFPKTEIYGLTSQIRRAAVSVPANITEGFKKTGKADKIRYYNIAQGSLEECRYYLLLTKDLKYCDSVSLPEQAEEISKLLTAYINSLSKSDYQHK